MTHALIAGAPAPARPLPPTRRPRGPWEPTQSSPYRLPRDAHDRLTVALMSHRNRDAAYALAVFVARFWSAPARLELGFPVDRRALAEHPLLCLSEHQVRAARDTLEAVGFLTRQEPEDGRHYRRTPHGPHRKPIIFRFGLDYQAVFVVANKRSPARRPIAQTRPASTSVKSSAIVVSHKHPEAEAVVIMGGQNPPQAAEPESALEAALARWRRAFEKAVAGTNGAN